MGIRNLTKLIREFAPNSIRQLDMSALQGKRVAVDANLFAYKFSHGPEAHATRAFYGFLDLVRWFKQYDIEAVFVFDGQTKLEAKRPEIERRCVKRKRLMNRVQECRTELRQLEQTQAQPQVRAQAPPRRAWTSPMRRRPPAQPAVPRNALRVKLELASLEQQIVHVSPQQIADCQHLLRLAGVSVLTAEHEAEATCATLNRLGCVDAVVSEDMDSLCFGCPVLLRDCRPFKRTVTEIRLVDLLHELRLGAHQFVDLCILCGCDFASTLRQLTHQEAYAAIQQYSSIEILLQHSSPPPSSFSYAQARAIFLNPPTISAETKANCLQGERARPRAVDDFLRRKVGWYRGQKN
jgi:flap endonuclease-1